MGWFRQLLRRRELYSDLSEEIRSHLDEQIEELISQGVPRKEAERQARRAFGNISLLEERGREAWQWVAIEHAIADLRYSIRRLTKAYRFSLSVILMLALSIAASGIVFSVVDLVLLHPLPFKNADRLLMPWEWHFINGRQEVSYLDFEDWRAQSHTFEDMAAYTYKGYGAFVLSQSGHPMEVQGTLASANLISLLGVQPQLGRGFTPGEETAGHDHVVLLSNGLWKSYFHSNPNVIGSTVAVSGDLYTVVGVLPSGLMMPAWADLWMPLSLVSEDAKRFRSAHILEVVGHRKGDVSIQQVRADMETIVHRLQQEFPISNGPTNFELVTLNDEILGKLRPALWSLSVAVALVLFMTCANVVNLLLLRAVASQQEIAVRSALGASRKRLLSHLLIEGAMLSCVAVCLGLLLSKLGLIVLRTYAVGLLPGAEELRLTSGVSLIITLVCVLLVVLCTTVPAFRVIQGASAAALKQGQRATASGAQIRTQTILLWVEVSLAVTVLIGTGLLLRSFHTLLNVDLGYQSHQILTAHLNLPGYSDKQIASFFDRLFPALKQLPGVDSVASVTVDPLTAANTRFAVADAPMPGVGHFPTAQFRRVSPDYFQVLHVPLWSGRGFTREDCDSGRILINRSLANKYFQDQDPVGRALLQGFFHPPLVRLPIVGVVGDVKDVSIEGDTVPTFYFCAFEDQSTLLIRTSMVPSAMNVSIEKAIHALDPDLAVNHVISLDQRINDSLWRQKISAWLFAVFAGFALVITVTGVSSVLSYSLSQRSKEIAVRIALGATKANLSRMLLRQIFSTVIPGILVGLLLSAAFSRTLSSLLFHVAPHDLLVFTAVPILVSAVILIAAGKPVRQGLKTDPVEALRGE